FPQQVLENFSKFGKVFIQKRLKLVQAAV
ncbi:hypothetical protein KKC1_26540, partial [Calderihabitans maritimus]